MFEFQDFLKDEKIILETRVSSKLFILINLIIFLTFFIFISALKIALFNIFFIKILIIIWLLIHLFLLYHYVSIKYIITNKRVIFFSKNIFFKTKILKYSEIKNAEIKITEEDKILNKTQTLIFFPIDYKNNILNFYFLENPKKILEKTYHYFL